MPDVRIEQGELHVVLSLPERVQLLHRATVDIPVDRVAAADAVSDVLAQVRGASTSGSGPTGPRTIGIWTGESRGRRFRDLVLVSDPGPGVVFTLTGADYNRILVSSQHPEQVLADLSDSSEAPAEQG